MSDLVATFLGFSRDAEVSALVLGKYLDRLRIQTEAAHGRLVQDEDMEREHGSVWGAIWNAVERSHSHHTENVGIKNGLLYQKNGVRSTGFHHPN